MFKFKNDPSRLYNYLKINLILRYNFSSLTVQSLPSSSSSSNKSYDCTKYNERVFHDTLRQPASKHEHNYIYA